MYFDQAHLIRDLDVSLCVDVVASPEVLVNSSLAMGLKSLFLVSLDGRTWQTLAKTVDGDHPHSTNPF